MLERDKENQSMSIIIQRKLKTEKKIYIYIYIHFNIGIIECAIIQNPTQNAKLHKNEYILHCFLQ